MVANGGWEGSEGADTGRLSLMSAHWRHVQKRNTEPRQHTVSAC